MILSQEQVEQFEEDGYLILPSLLSPEECSVLIQEAGHLLNQFDENNHPKTTFSTGDKGKHVGDDYFLTSGDKIRYFLEESAVHESSGKLTVPKQEAVNKIGHAIHQLNPVFRKFTTQEHIKGIARALDLKDPVLLQSMLIFKQPKIGGEVPPHQDSTFLYTDPVSAVGFWYALEPATKENGCLWFAPGSHKTHPVHKRFVRDPSGKGVTFINIADENKDEPNYVPVEVPAGSLVLIHGSALHKSMPNLSQKSRWVYAFHMLESANHYPDNNWLQPTAEMPFTKLYEFNQ